MADRRRRRGATSDEESEEISSESEHENEETHKEKTDESKDSTEKDVEIPKQNLPIAETDDKVSEGAEISNKNEDETEGSAHCEDESQIDLIDNPSPTELIDDDGGGEGIADVEEVEGEFLDDEILDGSEENDEDDDDDDGDECVKEEREQGDGEECATPNAEKELDFDEDRRNPQYIPKKGIFYEHDDRNAESPKEEKEDPTRDKKKKKLWLDDGKWGHDRYREDEQIPKSRTELIDAYGYDIRCEDGPPRARRRRRYGRGPTKYEPNWSEENGPGKERTLGMFIHRGNRGGRARGGGRFRGDFNRGGGGRPYNKSEPEDYIENNNYEEEKVTTERKINVNENINEAVKETKETSLCGWESDESPAEESTPVPVPLSNKMFPALPPKEVPAVVKSVSPDRSSAFPRRKTSIPTSESVETNSVRTLTFENSSLSNHRAPSYPSYEKPPRHGGGGDSLSPRGSSRRGFKRMPRGRQTRGSDRYNNNSGDSYLKPSLGPRLLDKQINRVSSDLERMNLNNRKESYENSEVLAHEQKHLINHTAGGMKPNTNMSSKHEDSASRPKRYSSLRQRSLPENPNYQPAQPTVAPPHASFYDTGYHQAALYTAEAVTPNPQPPSSVSPPVISPPQYQTYSASPYPEGYGLRVPVNNTPRLFPQVAGPTGQAIMTPPPCITPNPNMLNYPPPPSAPPTYPPQFAYQQYPAPLTAPPPPPPPPVSQPPDMFRGGITYYFPQPHPVMQVPQKRAKAAIPIIPPPENDMKMHDRKRMEELQYQDVDSDTDRTDSGTLQMHAPVEVES